MAAVHGSRLQCCEISSYTSSLSVSIWARLTICVQVGFDSCTVSATLRRWPPWRSEWWSPKKTRSGVRNLSAARALKQKKTHVTFLASFGTVCLIEARNLTSQSYQRTRFRGIDLWMAQALHKMICWFAQFRARGWVSSTIGQNTLTRLERGDCQHVPWVDSLGRSKVHKLT